MTNMLKVKTALSLIMSAITAQAAPIQPATTQAAKGTSTPISQSQLPLTIDKPGTYVLTGNLSYTSGSSTL